MEDKNIPIRQAYYSLLDGNVVYNGEPVPIYNGFVPQGYPSLYILLSSQNSVGRESKSDQLREMHTQFIVSTRLDNNSGWECDTIAGQILNLLYSNRDQKISGTDGTDLVSDDTMRDYDPEAKKQIVERIITFKHFY